ncbi:MAG: sigma-70 family RNA polymerase sigma factor [Mageeibacillus sp.]|jgi:RNA polymerase sigma-70 factor (ECF subfamily)|nr:sigma-70 family RNA polymerase sigma factor [Mageeibacillus sp.]MCI1264718.1 sigma-70 family RNA polymerase sigma factor [Saccharofermentans sp.]MCI2043887.1 sigma-70 family RNA polymerase sigma factor [Mageeibacillus sp.]
MMDDESIIELFFARSEDAITESKSSYGRLLCTIAVNILHSTEDAQECENDTYFHAWNTIPPQRPDSLCSFLARITRNLSLDMYDRRNAVKRGQGSTGLLTDELEECIPDRTDTECSAVEESAESELLTGLINTFLGTLRRDSRVIFMRRYWFGDSVADVAANTGYSVSKVKMSLKRSRDELRSYLGKEGFRL